MGRLRKRATGDIPVLMPEGKSGRRPPRRTRWVIALVALVLVVLAVVWTQLARKGP